MTLRFPRHARCPAVALALVATLCGVAPSRAQAPDGGVAESDEAPRREAPERDGGPPRAPIRRSPERQADSEASAPTTTRPEQHIETPDIEAPDEVAPDEVAPPSALADAGVPSESPPDAGTLDESVQTPPALSPNASAQGDAGVAPVAAPAAPTSNTTFVQWPVPFAPPTESDDLWAGLREILRDILPGIPMGSVGPLGLLALLALLALLTTSIERLRGRLLRDGWLPTLLSFVQVSARLLALLVGLALVVQVVPANVRWVVYFSLMASGAALGWSTRDVMPDIIAGVVIAFERRIRRGMWIRSSEFAGVVERIGLRSSWLRDSKGHRVAVPNRMLTQSPIVSDEEGDSLQEVVLRVSSGASATDVRRALHDAVLASPWTTPDCEPQVLRDPLDPELWQVRARLLSASFASAFQGQLLERAEANLAALDKRANPDKTEHPEGMPETPRTR